MNKQESRALAKFCTDQYYAFNAEEWLRRNAADRNHASTVAAMYLSMTSWYGHEEELEHVVMNVRKAPANDEEFQRAAQAIGFDVAFFSSEIRYEIALRRMGTASDRERQGN